MSDTPAAAPLDYAKYGDHAECVAEFDQLRDTMHQQFPPCPHCGCRTSDDADVRDCGCDSGCNDGEYPPGVNVLLIQARKQAAWNERVKWQAAIARNTTTLTRPHGNGLAAGVDVVFVHTLSELLRSTG